MRRRRRIKEGLLPVGGLRILKADRHGGASPATQMWRRGTGTGAVPWQKEKEKEKEGLIIAREGIELSQSRPPQRCIPCHADMVGGLLGRVTAPTAKAKFYLVDFPCFTCSVAEEGEGEGGFIACEARMRRRRRVYCP